MAVTATAAMSGVPFVMMAAGTTGNSSVVAPPMSFRNHNFLIKGSVGVVSGAVTIETSNDPNDANTWAPIVPSGSIANPATVVASTDILMAYSGLLMFARARVNTVLAGGTVTVEYLGGKNY